MNIGETIYKLRTTKNMSQGDLADLLDVSRQSVSKWETNQSVPDLDKIVKLSKIFEVTLDEFVLGEEKEICDVEDKEAAWQEPEKVVIIKEVVVPEASKGQKIAGVVLLCMAFVIVLALTFVKGRVLEGVILASPFLVCGLICMFAKKNAGLWCAWAVYLLFDSYTIWAIGVNSWRGFIRSLIHHGSVMTVSDMMAFIQLVVMLIIIVVTIIHFKDKTINASKRMLGLIIAGWVILFAAGLFEIALMKLSYGRMLAFVTKFFDWGVMILFTVVALYTVRFIRSRRKCDN